MQSYSTEIGSVSLLQVTNDVLNNQHNLIQLL